MRVFLVGLCLAALAAPSAVYAAQWVGEISDSACNAKHESGTENVPPPPAKQCTLDCVRGGSKFVLLSGGKVFQIANQNLAGLPSHAGDKVTVTGDLAGDTITITKIEAAK